MGKLVLEIERREFIRNRYYIMQSVEVKIYFYIYIYISTVMRDYRFAAEIYKMFNRIDKRFIV